ncbi:MAG: ABC transporter substrate-binding protein, partial [Deltaproteobacteria bacterium]|nr:ABC transporter substrate-binding protein [Deltaproteobacteria bacterium]
MTFASLPELGHGAEKKPKYGGRLRIGERYGNTGLDAHRNQETFDMFIYCLLYNALTIMGPSPEVMMYPDLAKSWEISADGRDYTFPLREGVKFHHGKELDSGDVKYSIERVMNPATRSKKAFSFQWIDSVNIIDKYHLKIRLKEPFGPFLTTLTIQNCPIIPAGWEPTATKPAPGTGPFAFKSIVLNETIELARFDQYWEVDEKTGDRLPYLDSIYSKKIVDPAVRWVAVRAGDVDYTVDPPKKMALEVIKNPIPGIAIIVPPPIGTQWIYFNVSKPPFNNQKVRQALAYTIDKKELIKAVHWGLAEPLNHQPFMNGSRMYISVKDREMNLSKAKQLLAEGGYPHGLKTEFLEPSGATHDIANCEYVIGQIYKIGIEATMKVIDRAAWFKQMRDGDYSISVRGDSERLDPDDAYYPRLHSSEIDKNNFSRYSNKEVDALLEKGRTTWKWEDRVPIYRKIVEIAKEELPIVYLAKAKILLVFRDYVKGLEGGAATWFGYYGGGLKKVWFDK